MPSKQRSKKETCRRLRQAGFAGLTDVLLGVAVAAILMPTLAALIVQQANEAQDQAAAVHLKAVREATQAMVKIDYDNIYANISNANNISSYGADELINRGLLPPGFRIANSFGQTPLILLRQLAKGLPTAACGALPLSAPANGVAACPKIMEVLIVTVGGIAIDPARASHIAVLSGAHGGIVADAGTARGSYGSWCISLASFGGTAGTCPTTDTRATIGSPLAGGPQPARGGLAAALFFSGGVLMNEYLDRFVTGDPEDNTMHTNLNMGDNSITAISTLIVNGVTVQANGTDTLSLKQGNGTDAKLTVGAVTASGDITTSGNVAATGNVTAAGNITASGALGASSATISGPVTATQFSYPP